jgi:hypothetical protein
LLLTLLRVRAAKVIETGVAAIKKRRLLLETLVAQV